MKRFIKIAMTLICASFLATACADDDIRYGSDTEEKVENVGYLSLSGLNVSVLSDTEIIAGLKSANATRTDINVGDFNVEIINSAGEKLHSFKYAECPTEPISLDVGNYTLNVYSGEVPAMAWESPTYGATKEFQIKRLQETAIGKVVCKLASIKVSVEYTEDVAEILADDTKVNIALGGNSADFSFSESRAAYFKALDVVNTLDLAITGSFRKVSEGQSPKFEMNSKINNVKAGQWRKITIIIEHASDGNIDVRVKVENWLFDETITVETSSLLMERVIVDDEDIKNAPQIIWVDNDIDQPLTLTDSMFDEYGDCTTPVRINISAVNLIAGLKVDISSTNAEFMNSLTASGFASSIDLCNPGAAAALLGALGYPTGANILGKESVTFNMQSQMKQLNAFGGTHTFQITATDESGLSTTKALTIKAGAGGPTIEWVGYDIDTRYEISDELTATIEVSSESGIVGFTVEIISDVLSASALQGVGLDSLLDLVNPANEEMNESLTNLGFPTREKVLNQKFISFSITQFLSLLDITGNGNHNFVMTVTDAEGGTTVKTLMLSDAD